MKDEKKILKYIASAPHKPARTGLAQLEKFLTKADMTKLTSYLDSP